MTTRLLSLFRRQRAERAIEANERQPGVDMDRLRADLVACGALPRDGRGRWVKVGGEG
jgi:hypothetical protein